MIRVFVIICSTFLVFSTAVGQELAPVDSSEGTQGISVDDNFDSGQFELGNWVSPVSWEKSFEVGINGAAGNTETFNLRTGFEAKRKTELVEVGLDIVYAKSSVSGLESQNFAQLDLNIDRLFSADSPWSVFGKTTLLYDEFRPFDVRLALNGGLGYKWIDNGITLLRTRVGAGVSREVGGIDNDWIPEAVFGIDLNHQFSKRQKVAAKMDYFPSWENFADYRLVTDIGWELLVDEASNMSLKFSLLDTYDSTPDGAKPNDINYGLLLLWKM